MPHDKHHDEDDKAASPPTPGKAEGTRHDVEGKPPDNEDQISSRKGNVTVGHTEGKAEGTRENVEASLRKQECEQKKHQ